MKDLKDIILEHFENSKFSIIERLHINKDTGKDTLDDDPIIWTQYADLYNILCMLRIEDIKFMNKFKDATNMRGDLYYFGVSRKSNLNSCKFLDRYLSHLNYIDYKFNECPKERIAKNLNHKEADVYIYDLRDNDFQKPILVLWIESDSRYDDTYIIGADKNDVQKLYDIFINDNWEENKLSLYDLVSR